MMNEQESMFNDENESNQSSSPEEAQSGGEKPEFPSGEPRVATSLDGFRLIPDAFFPQTKDYIFTIDEKRSYANTACVRIFPDAEYVQYLINAETRMFALRPCQPTDHHSFRWSREKNGKRVPRNRPGKEFSIMISSLMGWEPGDRYQFRGAVQPALCDGKEEMVLSFDLEYNRHYQKKVSEGGKTTSVPADTSWVNNLGPLYTEYSRSLKINNIKGYNVISTEKKERTGEQTGNDKEDA